MRVLAIDPGSETLGWGIIEGEKLKYGLVDFGTVKTSPKESFSKRVLKIGDGVAAVIEKFCPDVLSIEEAFYANNVKVALKLGQVRGAVLYVGEREKLELLARRDRAHDRAEQAEIRPRARDHRDRTLALHADAFNAAPDARSASLIG